MHMVRLEQGDTVNDQISLEEVLGGIDESYRPFLKVATATLLRPCMPVVEALWQAVRLVAPAIRFVQPVHVLLSRAPFEVPLSNGTLMFNPRPGVINVAMENIIFLDVLKIIQYPREIQIATIVEEFVHALMHVTDEELTSHIVALLYPGVRVVNGQYTVAT